MAKYGAKAGEKVEKAMHERKEGTLKSGSSGKKVTSRKQAIAIGLSEARAEGGKVPKKKSAAKKSTGKKTTAKKTSRKKKIVKASLISLGSLITMASLYFSAKRLLRLN